MTESLTCFLIPEFSAHLIDLSECSHNFTYRIIPRAWLHVRLFCVLGWATSFTFLPIAPPTRAGEHSMLRLGTPRCCRYLRTKKIRSPNDFWPNRIDQHYVEKMKKDWRGSFILHRPTTELQAASDQNTLPRVVHLNYSCNFLIFNIKVRNFYPTLLFELKTKVYNSCYCPHMA